MSDEQPTRDHSHPAPHTAMKPWLPEPQGHDSTSSEPDLNTPQLYASESADLAHIPMPKQWAALCFTVTLLVYLALIPQIIRYSNPPTGDQPFYLMVTISIVQDGDLNIANNFANRDEDKFYSLAPHPPGYEDMGAPYPLPPHNAFSTARPPDEQYNFHLPGFSLALVPAWVVGSWFQLWWPATIVFMCLVGALVALNIFMLAHELTGKLWIAWAVWAAAAFSNPLMSYTFLLFTELPTGLLAIYAFRRLALGWGANGPLRISLVGLCIAYIPWLAWRCIVIAIPLLIYAVVQYIRYRRAMSRSDAVTDRQTSLLPPALFTLPVLLSAALLAWHNIFLYGQVLLPSQVPEFGPQVYPFKWPWKGMEEFTHFVFNFFAHLFDRQMGLLTNAPIYLLIFVGLIAMFRSSRSQDRRLLWVVGLVVLPYVALICAFVIWNGLWNPPARFLTAVIPILTAPIAISLLAVKSVIYKGVYALLAIPGIVIMAIRMLDPRMLWPANPIFGWLHDSPLSPVRGKTAEIRSIQQLLPSFSPLDDLRLPAATAWMIAFSAALVLICFYLMQTRGTFIQRRQRSTTQGLFWSATFLALGLAWFVMNREYLEPRTILTEQRRWDLGMHMEQPLGISYLDGKIYNTDYRGGKVGVLDLVTGSYSFLSPISAQGGTGYATPGDVKVGPDGLLYVLNNGPDNQGLFVMKPDGTVVRQVNLSGKTPVATGLWFGQRGEMYVSDMLAGRVHKYDSGTRLIADLGAAAGFSNLTSVVVDEAGTIYAADITREEVKKLDPQGRPLATYPVKCGSWAMTIKDGWLDLTCGTSFISVNTRTGHIQKSRTSEGKPPLQAPTGLSYSPDGKLYMIDGSQIIEYIVER